MIQWDKIDHRIVTGTTSTEADTALLGQPTGEGVYLEGGDVMREGVNVPGTEVEFEEGDTDYLDAVTINSRLGLFVVAYADAGDSDKGKAIVGQKKKGDANVSFGTAVEFEAGATTDISICKLSPTTVAIGYIDDADSDYAKAIIGTITESTKTIEFGTAKSTAIAATKTEGTGICEPRDGVIALAYTANGDGIGEVSAALFSDTTIADFGTAVDCTVDTDNGGNIDCCSHTNGGICCVYQAGDTANDPLTMNIGTVSAANVVAFAGSEEALNAAAATSITCKTWAPGVVAVSWIDSGDAHIIAGTIATTVYTQGSELSVDAGTCLTPHFDILDDTHLIYFYENDAMTTPTDPGQAVKITRDDTTLEAGNIDLVTEASTQTCIVTALNADEFVFIYDDAANSNYGTANFGSCATDLLDVRSSGESKTWECFVVPIYAKVQVDSGY